MLEGILKGLLQWLYGLFLELITYCANALLGVMSTDLSFFEFSVPIVPSLYQVFVAVGWGLLIGNMAFQSMKAMFAGLGIETESPFILMLRTFLFGILLIFSKDICDMGLSICKNVIDLLGIPDSVTLTMPNETYFTGAASWLLVIIIGFILGFQLIKLFFEIAERYVIVAVLTLLMPVGLAMGGSKATKSICSGYCRMYASMLVLMVSNVLFLKLILSALATMPIGIMVLPWCLLIVGIAKTARKTDEIITRIGMNPAMTGDPLGRGRGMMTAFMVARTIMAAKGRGGQSPSNSAPKQSGKNGAASHTYSNNSHNQSAGSNANSNTVYNNAANGGNSHNYNVNSGINNTTKNSGMNDVGSFNSNLNNSNYNSGNVKNNTFANSHQTGFSTGGKSKANIYSGYSPRFGSTNYTYSTHSGKGLGKTITEGADRGNKVNTNRFGIQKENARTGVPFVTKANASVQKEGTHPQIQKSATAAKQETELNREKRFGSIANQGIRYNSNPLTKTGKPEVNKVQGLKSVNGISSAVKSNITRGMPNNIRFGSIPHRTIREDDILISREDDINV